MVAVAVARIPSLLTMKGAHRLGMRQLGIRQGDWPGFPLGTPRSADMLSIFVLSPCDPCGAIQDPACTHAAEQAKHLDLFRVSNE